MADDDGGNIHDLEAERKKREKKAAEEKARKAKAAKDWAPTALNAQRLLKREAAYKGLLGYDEMTDLNMLLRPLPVISGVEAEEESENGFQPRPLRDVDYVRLQMQLQSLGLGKLGVRATADAVEERCKANSYHPVRDYLRGLRWDGKQRIDYWLHDYLDCNLDNYTKGIGAMFLIAMVARVMRPGCQADYMPILEGPQGTLKSSACRVLGGDWFSESLPDLTHDKDAMQHLRGKWLIEIAELSAMSKVEAAKLKAYLTRTVDRYRASYGRAEVQRPRQCIFIGTTNEGEYLRDQTGGRRFWPVPTGSPNIAALKRDRDRLFAEAFVRFNDGSPWWPDASFEHQFVQPEQQERYEVDAWEPSVDDWLSHQSKDRFTISEIAQGALELPVAKIATSDARRLANVLTRLGWKRARKLGKGRFWMEDAS